MDKFRIYVWVALAALLYIAFLTWQQDYPAPKVVEATPPATASNAVPALPSASTSAAPATPSTVPSPPSAAAPEPAAPAPTIHISTDVLDLQISLRGGELIRADLPKYPAGTGKDDRVVRLLDASAENFFFARSGLRATKETAAPTHLALYAAAAEEFRLADGQETLDVPLTWTDGNGVKVTKSFTFKRGQYAIDVHYAVENQSSAEWEAASYVQIARRQPILDTSFLHPETYAFMGPSRWDGKSNKNLKLTDEDSKKDCCGSFTGGWMAAMQHHFVTAAVPKPDLPYQYSLTIDGPHQFSFGYLGPMVKVSTGSTGEIHETIFVGPKIQSQLEQVGSRLELTADYGRLAIIAGPLFALLSWVHKYIGNWGWSIILTTLLIKLVFYKLTETSGKSMAKMKEVAPRLKALQERYKDNREELGRATMEFYKREKINPLNGCLPMLIQMPVFMAFYWAILNSAEMRQAPFIGYLTDLSSRDPYFILPVILGVVNFIQFKLNPAPADPVQAKVMMFMPIMMTGLMVMFPSGLVLYWITNTGLSILQQWHINRVVAAQAKKT